MRLKSPSLSLTIPLFVIAITVLLSFAMSSYFSEQSRLFLYKRAEANATGFADFYLHVLEAFRGDFSSVENEKKMQRIVENIGVLSSIDQAFVVGPDLKMIARSDRRNLERNVPDRIIAPIKKAVDTGAPAQILIENNGKNHLMLLRPVAGGTGVLAVGVIIVDLSKEDAESAAYTDKITLIQYIVGGITAVLISFIISWRVLKPLASISKTVEALRQSDLSSRVVGHSDDELGRVSAALNATLDRLQGEMVSRAELEKVHQELLRSQESMVQSSKMASLGEMASGMAHEINNPVAIIYGRALHLKEVCEQSEVNKDQVIRASEKIAAMAMRVSKIVRSLRSFAREGSSDPLEYVAVDRIVEETLEFCRERFKHKSIQFEVDLINPDWRLNCRAVEISQVLLNLLNNALDAVDPAPQKKIHLGFAVTSTQIQISVQDSGIGVPAEIRAKIMQPFFTTKEVGKGTGLGLSVSKGIAETHNGRLFLDPDSSNTRFVLELPLHSARSIGVDNDEASHLSTSRAA